MTSETTDPEERTTGGEATTDREQRADGKERASGSETTTDGEEAAGTETFTRAAVAADLRHLVERVEGIHADPFHGYESRVALHRDLETTIRDLPETVSRERAYRAAAGLVAGLDDAHSRVAPPDDDEGGGDEQLPVSLRVVGDAVYVDGVYEESLADVLGARLVAVEGESVERMADRYTALRGVENRYFTRSAVAKHVARGDWLDRLLAADPGATPTLRLRLPDGTETERSVTPVDADAEPTRELAESDVVPAGTGPRYRLSEDGRTAVFVPGNLTHYREVIQAARDRGAEHTEVFAREAYRAHHDEDPPGDLDEIVPRLPSMSETLADLVRDMDEAGTEGLVVDLRDNPGGDSRFVQYMAYYCFGWERLVEASDWPVALKRRTPTYREQYGDPEHDEYATHEANPADYDFATRFRAREASLPERVDQHRETLTPGAFGDELEDERHEGYYAPSEVVVATTARTMSSAFAGAALLSELGADVVGVPSGQAPLSFGEAVDVELPNTGLAVDLAGSLFRWTPDPTEDVLPVARELTPTLFEERYDRAGDAVLQLALDHLDGDDD